MRMVCGVIAVAVSCVAAGDLAEYRALVKAHPSSAAQWSLEGDLRDGAGGFDGTASGRVGYFAGVGGGKCVSLAEGGFVSCGNAPKLDLDATTVELFFRVNASIADNYNPCLIAKRNTSQETRFSLHVMKDLGSLGFWNGQQVVTVVPADGPFQLGRWYHVAISNSPERSGIYIDGIKCFRGGNIFNLKGKKLPLQMGASAPDGAEQFRGDIDEVAIYGAALTDDDIAAHVDAVGWAEKRKGLVEARRKQIEEARRVLDEKRAKTAEKLRARLDDPALTAQGEEKRYGGEHLEGISFPVGGIGTGLIQMNGKGELATWQIFNNYTYARVPHSFFAISVTEEGKEPVVRALQTEPVGCFPAMERLSFSGEYPIGLYTFEDKDLPLHLSMQVFNPLAPMNEKDSAIPCAIFRVMVKNAESARPVKVRVLAAQQNAVGFNGAGTIEGRAYPGYGKNINRVIREKGITILHMTADQDKDSPAYGDMALAVLDDAQAAPSFDSLETLRNALVSHEGLGRNDLAGPSPAHETVDGALEISNTIKFLDCSFVTFILAWHFPNAKNGQQDTGWKHEGHMYSNWYPDALAVVRDAALRYHDLFTQTEQYHDTFYGSNLPRWLLDRISSQVAILRSNTCYWAKDGYFGGWEGCNPGGGCCFGNCAHVWHYAQAHARLFPSIARRMREQQLDSLQADGGAPFRQPKDGIAVDAQCGEVLEAYREHLTSTDNAWLDGHWGKIKRVMDYAVTTWDSDRDGVLSGSQHNTLDCWVSGSTSWLGSMYLAALKASVAMAKQEKDDAVAATYAAIFDSGAKKQNETLFNGEYWIQVPDAAPQSDYDNGCCIDQVLGQWWANQLDLGWIYPRDRVRSGLASLLKYNFHDSFQGIVQAPRKFVDDNDAGMQMIQWPDPADRPMPHTLYADEVMSGFEYSAAAAMIQAGMLKEGLVVLKAVSDRYDGRLRKNLSGGDCTSWGYSGNPFGDDECGKFYARAMSVWSVLLACQGFVYDGPAGKIGFKPVWQPEEHKSFFTAAEGYGTFEQQQSAHVQSTQISVRAGKLDVSTVSLAVPPGKKAELKRVFLFNDPRQLEAKLSGDGAGNIDVALGGRTTLPAHETMLIELTLKP